MRQSPGSNPAESAGQYSSQLIQLMEEHFSDARARVDDVYRRHFASPAAITARHWRNRGDIPDDLLLLPRTLGRLLLRRKTEPALSGKQQEIRHILEQELLDLPGLNQRIAAFCESTITGSPHLSGELTPLTAAQQAQFEAYVQRQLERLQLPGEGIREGLLAVTVMLTGRMLGDKALLSSAASLGSTMAASVYVSQQGWWGALWAGWFGVPGWVTWAGIGGGVTSLLLLSPLLAPGVELGVNRLRARRLLTQTVDKAAAQVHQPDNLLMVSKLGMYLQLLPDLAQYLARLRGL